MFAVEGMSRLRSVPIETKQVNYRELKVANATKSLFKVLVDDGIDAMPHWVAFQTTYVCNLRCPHCQTHGTEELRRQYNSWNMNMSRALLEKAISDALPHATTFALSLSGEPLATPNLFEILEHCGQFQARLDLTTNGTLLTPSLIMRLVPYLERICFSIDGATETVCEALRLGASFRKLLHNIRLLTRTLELWENRPEIQLSLAMTIMGSNIREMPEMVRLAKALRIPRVEGYPVIVFKANQIVFEDLNLHKALYNLHRKSASDLANQIGIQFHFPAPFPSLEGDLGTDLHAKETMLLRLPADYYGQIRPIELYLDEMEIDRQARNIASDLNSGVHTLPPTVGHKDEFVEKRLFREIAPYLQGLNELLKQPDRKIKYCGNLHNRMYISCKGEATPCCVPGRPVLGNLNHSPIHEIWNGENYEKFRRAFLSQDPPKCCRACSSAVYRPVKSFVKELLESIPELQIMET